MGKDSKLGIDGLYLVLVFLALLFFFFSRESEAAEIEIGPTSLSGDFAEGGALLLTEREGKWSFGGGYVSKQFVQTCPRPDCAFDIEENIFFQVQRVVDYKKWEMGIGPAYFQNTNRALGKNLTWGLSLGYRGERFSIRLRHYSNAGSGTPNLGQDMITVGYDFE